MFQENGLWAIIMEYVDGDDLEVYVDHQGVLSESEALRYIDQLGQALKHVHQKGFLHRDVKPSSILLCREDQQAVGGKITQKSDIFYKITNLNYSKHQELQNQN